MAVRKHRALLWIALASVLVAACTTTVPRAATPPTTPATGARTPGSRSLHWTSCHSNFQCATLTVPLDWFEPDHRTIHLALVRKPATDRKPIGSVVLNPGGPGEPGTDFLEQFVAGGTVPATLTKHFNLVSWDPRGTGNSAGIACLSTAELTAPDPLPYPPTAAARAKAIAKDRAENAQCLKEDGRVIPFVGTAETVHDLDAIRAALGEAKLTYVGFSYGTAIGLEYLKDFGSRVRAMVLDGIDPPGTDPVEATRAQMASFEANLDLFLADCKHDTSCPFGDGHPDQVLLRFLDGLEAGKRLPASYQLPDDAGKMHSRDGTLGYTEAVTGIAAALYNRQSWPTLRQALAAATRTADPNGHILLALRDALGGRQADGSWNHSTEANAAISCADQSERAKTAFGSPARIRAWARAMPVFGAFGASGLPGCYDWPAARYPLEPLTKQDLHAAPPVVLVNSAHDPATPYAAARQAAALLPGSRLVTWGGDDHTSFAGGHPCIDHAVTAYLIDKTLPPAGTRCAAHGN